MEEEQKSDDEEEKEGKGKDEGEKEEGKGAVDEKKVEREEAEEEEEEPGVCPSINLLLIQHSREVRRVLECAAKCWRPGEKESVRFLSGVSATAAS